MARKRKPQPPAVERTEAETPPDETREERDTRLARELAAKKHITTAAARELLKPKPEPEVAPDTDTPAE